MIRENTGENTGENTKKSKHDQTCQDRHHVKEYPWRNFNNRLYN